MERQQPPAPVRLLSALRTHPCRPCLRPTHASIHPCLLCGRQTWRNWDLSRMTMHELYTQFGLDVQTIDFVGHAIALHQNDAYMMQVRARHR